MRNCASLAWMALLSIVCYSVIKYIGKIHQVNEEHKRTRLTQRNNHQKESKLRPWEQCETAKRYVFLKKHKVASR